MAYISLILLIQFQNVRNEDTVNSDSTTVLSELVMITFCLICHAYNNTSSTKATASSVPLDLQSVEVLQMIIELRSNLIHMYQVFLSGDDMIPQHFMK